MKDQDASTSEADLIKNEISKICIGSVRFARIQMYRQISHTYLPSGI